jgi:hypothetical protein
VTTRKKPRPAPAPPPPPPAKLVHEGFYEYQTPDPSAERLRLSDCPRVGNFSVDVYRYRVTVERMEEPRDVLIARLVELYRGTTNHHDHEKLRGEAFRRFGVDLREVVKAAPPPAPPAPGSAS